MLHASHNEGETAIATAEIDKNSFPWTGRTKQEWDSVETDDINTLLGLAAKRDNTTHIDDLSFLSKWHLQDAVSSVIARGDIPAIPNLLSDTNQTNTSSYHLATSLLPVINEAFYGSVGSNLFRFLSAMRTIRSQRMKEDRERVLPKHEPFNPNQSMQEAIQRCQFTGEQAQQVLKKFTQLQEVVTIMYEELMRKHRDRYKTNTIDKAYEDQHGYIAVRLVETLITHFWEPVTIDPTTTIQHYILKSAIAANYSIGDQKTDTRGVESYRRPERLLNLSTTPVETTVLERELEGVMRNLSLANPTNGIIIEALLEGRSIREIQGILQLGKDTVSKHLQQIRETLAGYLEKTVIPSDRRTSPVWEDIQERKDYYQDLLDRLGPLCLLDSQQLIFATALASATGEHNSTVAATVAALNNKYSPAHVQRQIRLAADLLQHMGLAGRIDGNWLTRNGVWQQEREQMQALRNDPSFWNTISTQQQELIEKYYLQPTTAPGKATIASQLQPPIHPSAVTRRLDSLQKLALRHIDLGRR